ncbi:MAG: leucyl aminopeptidase, partial [Chloroflexi bacterium]|nr:leucyl aminopeptidase [Chloroflexota bacterium]
LSELDQAVGGGLSRLVDLGELRGKLHEVAAFIPDVASEPGPAPRERGGAAPLSRAAGPGSGTASGVRAPRIVLVGAGKPEDFTVGRARTVAGTAVRFLRRRQVRRAAIWLHSGLDPLPQAAAIIEGATLAQFDTGVYKTHDDRPADLDQLVVVEPDPAREEGARAGADRGRVLGEATNLARRLANEPANRLGPVELASAAQQLAGNFGLECDVLDERRIAELGMGAIVGVAQGSDRPPRVIVLRYRTESSVPPIGLVGKAVMFDSGGISIKPAEHMHEMKMDMSGGAAVLGAMQAIAQLKPRVEVIGVIAATENLISGHAMRPGDVIATLSGKTVEVLNTDAEGRLILADAITYARRLGAERLVDIATLTGAIVVALGHAATGVFGRPHDWVELVRRAAEVAGERTWLMPLFDEYREQLRSGIADIANVGGRPGGAGVGATFLAEFVEPGMPWAHLDIAGTAWTEKDLPYLAKGPTGVGVRTLAHFAFQAAAVTADERR